MKRWILLFILLHTVKASLVFAAAGDGTKPSADRICALVLARQNRRKSVGSVSHFNYLVMGALRRLGHAEWPVLLRAISPRVSSIADDPSLKLRLAVEELLSGGLITQPALWHYQITPRGEAVMDQAVAYYAQFVEGEAESRIHSQTSNTIPHLPRYGHEAYWLLRALLLDAPDFPQGVPFEIVVLKQLGVKSSDGGTVLAGLLSEGLVDRRIWESWAHYHVTEAGEMALAECRKFYAQLAEH